MRSQFPFHRKVNLWKVHQRKNKKEMWIRCFSIKLLECWSTLVLLGDGGISISIIEAFKYLKLKHVINNSLACISRTSLSELADWLITGGYCSPWLWSVVGPFLITTTEEFLSQGYCDGKKINLTKAVWFSVWFGVWMSPIRKIR